MTHVHIVDREGLSEVMQTVLGHCETQREAAAFLGIGQRTLNRYLREQADTMKRRTHQRMRRVLARHELQPIDAILRPEQPFAGLLLRFDESVMTEEAWAARLSYEEWLDRECARLRPTCHEILLSLWKEPPFRSRLSRFLQQVSGSGDLPPRCERRYWLALYRAVEPLAGWDLTLGVERSWSEMEEAGDFRSYLKAALNRERILLQRERGVERYKQVAGDVDPPEWDWEDEGPEDVSD